MKLMPSYAPERSGENARFLAELERVVGALVKIENAVYEPTFRAEVRATRLFWDRRCQQARRVRSHDSETPAAPRAPFLDLIHRIEELWRDGLPSRARDEQLAVQFGRAEALIQALVVDAAQRDAVMAALFCLPPFVQAAAE